MLPRMLPRSRSVPSRRRPQAHDAARPAHPVRSSDAGSQAFARRPCSAQSWMRGTEHPIIRSAMPKYLIEASYTLEGVKGVQSAGGTSRSDAIAKVAESVGGRVESF